MGQLCCHHREGDGAKEWPAWGEIAIKSPLIFFVSLLFLAGVAGFAIIFAMSLHKDLAVGVPAGNLAARIASGPWTLSAMTVGFLSVPDADRVADRIREAIEQIPPKRR